MCTRDDPHAPREQAREANSHWQQIEHFRQQLAPGDEPAGGTLARGEPAQPGWLSQLPNLGLASSMDLSRAAASRPGGKGRGSESRDAGRGAHSAPDVPAQVLGRLFALLKEKETKWRTEMRRASVLEGENAELRARLAASEQTNERLRSRLHSTVAAFHRTLAQEKGKLEDKDSELARIKTHSLQLQGSCFMAVICNPPGFLLPQEHAASLLACSLVGVTARA